MLSLTGRTAFITGASRGLGRLIALFLARQGCDLVIHSRDLRHTAGLLLELEEHNIQAHAVAAELEDRRQVETMVDELLHRRMPIDVVFNNAAIQGVYHKDFWRTPVAELTEILQVNFIAAVQICNRLIPGMLERGFGRVINVTSGIAGEPELGAYAASKAALDKYTLDIAGRSTRDVLINRVDPDWCRTDLGGPSAPNDPASSLPGMVIGAFVNDGRSGRLFRAQDYTGMSLEQAVAKAEQAC